MPGFCIQSLWVWSLSFVQSFKYVCVECGHMLCVDVCIHKSHFPSSLSLVPRPLGTRLVFTTLGTLAILSSLHSGVVLSLHQTPSWLWLA